MKHRIWRGVLYALVLLSLIFNIVLAFAVLRGRSQFRAALLLARNALDVREQEPWTIQVALDQDMPIETTVPINHTFVLPLNMEYPISTVVNTHIDIPLLGRQEIAIPIEATIPISYTVEVPIQMDVPISMTYHLQTEVPVEVDIPPELFDSLNDLIDQLDDELHLNLGDPDA